MSKLRKVHFNDRERDTYLTSPSLYAYCGRVVFFPIEEERKENFTTDWTKVTCLCCIDSLQSRYRKSVNHTDKLGHWLGCVPEAFLKS